MKTLLITPTYGRIPFLNRLVASFCRQDYDDKELVIINDDRNVQICCETKNVTCINLNKKILVGQKRNLAITLGFHDLYLPHDDDDIFLPNRISNCVKKHLEHPETFLYHNTLSYLVYGSEFKVSSSGPSCISFTREGWFDGGGYAHTMNAGEDQEFLNKIKNKLTEEDKENIDYVYNFSGLNYHLSCHSDKTIEEIAYNQLVEMNLLNSKYYIEPDFIEYDKFVELDGIYKEKQVSISITHFSLGKIKIVYEK